MVTSTWPQNDARRFALSAVAWGIGLFAVLRLPRVEQAVLLPMTQVQGDLAVFLFGAPVLPLQVTLACSAADAIALSTSFICAYPARWGARAIAAAGGIALILLLNTVRIGSLGAATSGGQLDLLHLYVWPSALILAIAGYVFTWMRWTGTVRAVEPVAAVPAPFRITGRFVVTAAALLLIFTSAAPFYLESGAILALAGFMAGAAATVLQWMGVEANATGNVLLLAQGGFLVTQECITTPLIPVYVAAVLAYSRRWRRTLLLILATVPLFVGLGILRLLVVALPPALVESPIGVVHAFYQVVAAAVLVALAAAWRHGGDRRAWGPGAAAAVTGCLAAGVSAAWYTPLLAAAFPGAPMAGDAQGALRLLPAYQAGLYAALSVATVASRQWRIAVAGLAVLLLSQVMSFALLQVLQEALGFAPHTRDVRAWALAVPVLLVFTLVTYARPRP